MNRIPLIDIRNYAERLALPPEDFQRNYYAMYSSVLGGIVTDPRLMLVPVDDHMVHRGDGVFETVKCVQGRIYNLPAHLGRLLHSASGVHLQAPFSPEEVRDIIVETVRAGQHRDCLIRLLLARGPGSLGVSPYECPKSALYVVISRLPPPFMEQHPEGARARPSALPVKPGPFATIKSVNYLFNVLMKKEAVDAKVDFVLSFDENAHLAEGPTENAGIVTADRRLQVPRPERILAGTTMLRVLKLAAPLVDAGELTAIEQTDIPRQAVRNAAEMLIFGTTPDVTAVVEFDGKPVGDGKPGPVFRRLSRLLVDDILANAAMQTPAF